MRYKWWWCASNAQNELNNKCMPFSIFRQSADNRIPFAVAQAAHKWNAMFFFRFVQFVFILCNVHLMQLCAKCASRVRQEWDMKCRLFFHWKCWKVLDFVESSLLRFHSFDAIERLSASQFSRFVFFLCSLLTAGVWQWFLFPVIAAFLQCILTYILAISFDIANDEEVFKS